jgi:thiol:disulfide interchange protein DsbA
MNKRTFIHGLIGTLMGLTIALPAQAQLTVGKEYTGVSPNQPTENAAKIEVLEFFSYNCIHCFRLHPFAKEWEKTAAKDIEFKRVPVTFNDPRMVPTAKLFYTLELTGDLARLDDAVFKAIHDEKTVLMTDDAVRGWVGKQGVDMNKFNATYDSFGVKSKVSRAEQMAKAYQVKGTPQVYVDGRYAVRNEGVTSYGHIMTVATQLADKVRADRGKK